MPRLLLYSICSLLVVCAACQPTPQETKEAKSPAFQLANTDTLPYPIVANFDELEPVFHQSNDTTYVINFWATWCAPCVEEIPYFEQLEEEYKGKPLKIIMISLDFRKNMPLRGAFIQTCSKIETRAIHLSFLHTLLAALSTVVPP